MSINNENLQRKIINMKSQDFIYIGIAAIIIIAVVMYSQSCKITCDNQTEDYTRTPLSGIGTVKRAPVTYAYQKDGVTPNPHYGADPQDRLVPLELGGHNPYKREVNPELQPILRQEVDLVNDGKLRKDMVESGDMQWHRTLNNMEHPNAGALPGYIPFEMDFLKKDIIAPLYADSFHNDAIFGQ